MIGEWRSDWVDSKWSSTSIMIETRMENGSMIVLRLSQVGSVSDSLINPSLSRSIEWDVAMGRKSKGNQNQRVF